MIMSELVRKLGSIKVKVLNEKFDQIYEEYKKKALEQGLSGELKFKRERGKVIIFAKLHGV